MHEEGGDADVEGGEGHADQRHQGRGAALEFGLQGQADRQHAGQRTRQYQGHLAQAAEDHGAEVEGQEDHQRGHHGEPQQGHGRAGVEGVEAEQDALGALSRVAQAQMMGQVRIEQGVGDDPEDVEAEMLDIGAGGDGGGNGHVGQHPGVVFAQHGRRGGGVEHGELHGWGLSLVHS
ncbi:hypothetical protein D9M70_412310 [compost metagenome]